MKSKQSSLNESIVLVICSYRNASYLWYDFFMLKKWVSLILGFISLIVGVIAAFIPLLPSFPFLLLTFVLFSKNSKKMTNWFVTTKVYKNSLESYVKGEGLSKQAKVRLMIVITFVLSLSAYFTKQYYYLTILLSIIWLFHFYYFFVVIKTKKD